MSYLILRKSCLYYISKEVNRKMAQQEQSGNTIPMIAIAAVFVVAIGGIILVNANKKTSPETAAQSQVETIQTSPEVAGASDSATGETATAEGEVKTFEIEAGSFYYKPAEIRVKKGDKVKIVIKSVDMMHDFTIDELGVKTEITKAGETSEAEFIADQVGSFEYYCSVGQHRQRGQVGTLIVEE